MQDLANHDAARSTGRRASLSQRWEAGEHHGTLLWEELKAQGYTGSSRSIYRRLALWKEHPRKPATPASPESVSCPLLEDVTPRQVIGWIVARPETLSPKAQEQLERITQMDDILAQARKLTHGFLHLIRHHSAEGLDTWLKDVRTSGIREFLTFARSVERDKPAILAGLTLSYSTGPVEGHINRRQHHPHDKPMVEQVFLICNTASCPLPN